MKVFLVSLVAATAFGSEADLAKLRQAAWEKIESGPKEVKTKLRDEALPKELGLVLQTATFPDAIAKMGPGTKVQTGDASTSERVLCYVGRDGTTVAFFGGEMDGDRIGHFEVNPASVAKCSPSKLVSKHLTTSSGLQLGLTRSKTSTLFGPPSKKDADYDFYRYEAPAGKDCTSWEEVWIHFFKDKVDRFALRRGSYC